MEVLGRDRFGNEQTFTRTALQGYTFAAEYTMRVGQGSTLTTFVELREFEFVADKAGATGLNADRRVLLSFTPTKTGSLVTTLSAVNSNAGSGLASSFVTMLASSTTSSPISWREG